jgi:hypothetical protein
MNTFRRRIFLIDPKVQGLLTIRVVGYWLFSLFTISFLLICWNVLGGPARPFGMVIQEVYQRFAPTAAVSLIVLPLVVMDVLRVSNRFAGPAYRLKHALRDLADGKDVRAMTFRETDFWQETAADFNRVASLVARATNRQTVTVADDSSSASPAPQSSELACH